MNYNQQIKNLLAEAREGIQYAPMSAGEEILTIIAMIPLYGVCCLLIGLYYISLFFYNAILTPTSYLEQWLEEKRKDVHHATEAVLYLICIPAIFLNKILISFISYVFYFQWFFIQIAVYLATLGGIKWQPSINLATYKKRKYILTTNSGLSLFYTILTVGILMFYLFTFIICAIDGNNTDILVVLKNITGFAYVIMITVLNPLIFRKKDMPKKPEGVTESSPVITEQIA